MKHVCVSELREDKCQPQGYLVDGVKALISSLKTWLRREVRGCPLLLSHYFYGTTPVAVVHGHFLCVFPLQLTQPNSEVPDDIRPGRLIKALTKEIRYLEVRQA